MHLALETELLFELSMHIGNSTELEPMLHQFSCEMLRLLNGSGAAVCRLSGSDSNQWSDSAVLMLPRNLQDDQDFIAFKKMWRPMGLYATLSELSDVQVVGFDGKQAVGYAFFLPQFGVLLLMRKRSQEPLSPTFLRALTPLMDKLAGAARACVANEQLVLERQRLRLATRSAGIGVWEWDIRRDNLFWDHQMLKLHGLRSEEFSGSLDDWGSRILPEDQVITTLHLLAALEHERHFVMEFRIWCRGTICHLRGHGEVFRDSEGEPVRVIGVMSDITARKTMEHKLRERVEFEGLVATLSARFVSVDIDDLDYEIESALGFIGPFIRVDRSYVMLLNADQDLIRCTHEWYVDTVASQRHCLQRITTHQLPWLLAQMQAREIVNVNDVDDLPEAAAAERRWLRQLGVESVLILPLWSANTLLGMMAFDSVLQSKVWTDEQIRLLRLVGDIVASALERQRKYQQLQWSEARHRRLVAAIPDRIFRLSPQGDILDYASGHQHGALMPTSASILGQSFCQFFDVKIHAMILQKIEHALQQPEAVQIMECQWTQNELTESVEIRMTPGSGGEVIAIVRNVDERARLERMRSEFINDASHELRTPLTTITMMVDLLEGGGDDPESEQQYWSVLKAELDRAHLLIEDLLAWGRLESGRLRIAVQPQDLAEVIAQARQSVQPMADNNAVTLDVVLPNAVPEVMGNHYALLQVFVNLLNNAVKFTPEGGSVHVTLAEAGERIVVTVQDTGIGIPEEDLPQLFGRFFRASNAVAADIPGSGMGLSLVRGILEEMEGRIDVSSVLHQGTTFTVSLPRITGS